MDGAVVEETTFVVEQAEEVVEAQRADVDGHTFLLDYDREVAHLVLEGALDPGMVPRAVKEDVAT